MSILSIRVTIVKIQLSQLNLASWLPGEDVLEWHFSSLLLMYAQLFDIACIYLTKLLSIAFEDQNKQTNQKKTKVQENVRDVIIKRK